MPLHFHRYPSTSLALSLTLHLPPLHSFIFAPIYPSLSLPLSIPFPFCSNPLLFPFSSSSPPSFSPPGVWRVGGCFSLLPGGGLTSASHLASTTELYTTQKDCSYCKDTFSSPLPPLPSSPLLSSPPLPSSPPSPLLSSPPLPSPPLPSPSLSTPLLPSPCLFSPFVFADNNSCRHVC